jgi:hypothetical protein
MEDAAEIDHWSRSSLRRRFMEILEEAELRFGAREPGREILEPELHADVPRCMFLLGGILVKLGDSCRGDVPNTVYQMAHEAVHCLAPVDAGAATVLEEGLATKFACDLRAAMDGHANGDHLRTGSAQYDDALNRVRRLLASTGDPGVRSLRASHPKLSPIDAATIRAAFPGVSASDADALARAF